MHEPIRIITISRLFGAGGSSLADALGKRLGWKVLDRALVAEVARRLQRPEADVAAIDEQVLGPWERAAAFASAAFPEMPIPPLQAYLNASIVSTVKEVLLDEAAVGEADNSMRLAMNFRREMAELSKGEGASWFTVLGSKPLREVFENALENPRGAPIGTVAYCFCTIR